VSSKIPPKFLEGLGLSGHEKNGHEKNGHDALGERVLLAEAIEMGVDPPDELEPDVLIRGAVHWVYAPAASGKTWLALWLIKRCLDRGQRVVYFDSENGRRITAERLALLGVDAARVDELLQYRPFPTLDTQSA
jgi:RecA/RadA recombinase